MDLDTPQRDGRTSNCLREPLLESSTSGAEHRHSDEPAKPSFRSSKTFITVVVAIAVFTDTFLYTLIIPILPSTLTDRANIPIDHVQEWNSILIAIYGAANLIVSPFVGQFVDKAKTRRFPLLVGLLILIIATTIYCFARNIYALVGARSLQGAAASLVHVAGLSVLSDTLGATKAGTAIGWQAIGMLFGSILGPSLGGFVFDHAGHYAVFGMAYGVLAIDLILRIFMVEKKREKSKSNGGLEEANYGTLAPAEGFSEVHSGRTDLHDNIVQDGNHATSIGGSDTSTVSLLQNRRIRVALLLSFAMSYTLTGLESVIPLYTRRLFDWAPTQSGMVFILFSASFPLDPYIGHLTDKHGPRTLCTIGLIIGTGLWVGFSFVTHNTTALKIVFCVLMLLLGFAIGAIQTPNVVEISLAVDSATGGVGSAELMGRAYAYMNMAYGSGTVLGPICVGLLIDNFGWRVLCWTFMTLFALCSIVAFFWSGSMPEKELSANRDLTADEADL